MAIWVTNHLLTGMVLQVSSYGGEIWKNPSPSLIPGDTQRAFFSLSTRPKWGATKTENPWWFKPAPKYVVKMFLFLKTLLPSRKLTYPAKREKENHRLKSALGWDMLVPRRVYIVWVVVSNIFYFNHYLGKISILTSILINWVGSTTN